MYCELSTTASKLMYLWRRWDYVGAQWCETTQLVLKHRCNNWALKPLKIFSIGMYGYFFYIVMTRLRWIQIHRRHGYTCLKCKVSTLKSRLRDNHPQVLCENSLNCSRRVIERCFRNVSHWSLWFDSIAHFPLRYSFLGWMFCFPGFITRLVQLQL